MIEFSLADVGLETVGEAAARKGWLTKTIQNWIGRDLIAAARVGSGRGVLLVKIADVDAFTPPEREDGRGRPLEHKPRKRRAKAAAADQAPAAARPRKARRGRAG